MNKISLQDVERENLITGHIPFFGAFAQQNPASFLSFNRLLMAYNFSQIIELGTSHGGLGLFFALYCYLSKIPVNATDPNQPYLQYFYYKSHHKIPKSFYTFDNQQRDKNMVMIIQDLGGIFEQRDLLGNEEDKKRVSELISLKGRTLLLCDNGDKIKEFNYFSQFLKPGDFIMAHDYAKDRASFENLERQYNWSWFEIQWSDIKDSCEKYNIKSVYGEEFNNVAWFCGEKGIV